MDSHAKLERPYLPRSPSSTLGGRHPSGCSVQPTGPAVQPRASARLGPQRSVVLGRHPRAATRVLSSTPRHAGRAGAYTGSASAGTRCGKAMQARVPPIKFKPTGPRTTGREVSWRTTPLWQTEPDLHRGSAWRALRRSAPPRASDHVSSLPPQRLVVLCEQPSNPSLKRTRREASLVYAGIPAARRLASPLDRFSKWTRKSA